MPVNFCAVMKKMNGKIEISVAKIPDRLCLSDCTSKRNMDIYLTVDNEVDGAENATLSGKFLSKVYEVSLRETEKWCRNC